MRSLTISVRLGDSGYRPNCRKSLEFGQISAVFDRSRARLTGDRRDRIRPVPGHIPIGTSFATVLDASKSPLKSVMLSIEPATGATVLLVGRVRETTMFFGGRC